MNLKLVIALVIIIDGVEDETKTSYFSNPQHCRWVAQELSRERSYFQGFEEGSIFCRPEWVPDETKVTRLNVIPMPEVDEDVE